MFNRNEKLGQLSELQKRRKQLKYHIHSAATSICICFEPMDAQCDYTEKINLEELNAYHVALKEKKLQLDKVNAEIERLKNELGEGNDE